MLRSLFFIFLCISCASSWALSKGDKAPAFSLFNLSGDKTIQLSDYQGKVIYLDFWASWCPPCRISLPLLEKMRTELAHQNFEIIAINVDENPQDAKDFLKTFPVSYPIGGDKQGKLPELYQVQGMPTAFIIDKKGVIRVVHTSFKRKDIAKIKQVVSQLLAQ